MEKIANYCSKCFQETNHRILFTTSDTYGEYQEITASYEIVECLGCEQKSFRYVTLNDSAGYEDEYGNHVTAEDIELYPKVLRGLRKTLPLEYLPEKILVVYRESLGALTNGFYLLTGIGFRALIEAICIDKNVIGRDLYTKISNLAKSKLITESEFKRLHAIRFLGNDSVHEINVPNLQQLTSVLDIVDHLLQNLYVIDSQMKIWLTDTVIDNYKEFKILLAVEIRKEAITKKNEYLTLQFIFGKSYRRLHDKVIEFEKILKHEIDARNCVEFSAYQEMKNPSTGKPELVFRITGNVEAEEFPF